MYMIKNVFRYYMRRPFKLINASEKDKYTPTIYIDFPMVKFVYFTINFFSDLFV